MTPLHQHHPPDSPQDTSEGPGVQEELTNLKFKLFAGLSVSELFVSKTKVLPATVKMRQANPTASKEPARTMDTHLRLFTFCTRTAIVHARHPGRPGIHLSQWRITPSLSQVTLNWLKHPTFGYLS